MKRIREIYSRQTLHQKMRLSIILFSMIPLICLGCILLPIIWQNQIGSLRKEIYDEAEHRFSDMNYEMNTIELMAKTVWSDTTFLTEVGKAAIDNTLDEYNRYLFQEQTLSTLRVITSISQVQSARLYLDYPGLREYASHLYSMDRGKVNRWYEDRNALGANGAWYMDVSGDTTYGTYSTYFTGKNMASFVIPLRISSKLTGIFEIVLPMSALVPDLYENTNDKDIFLIDSDGLIFGAAGEAGQELSLDEVTDLMEIGSIREYDETGINIYQGIWRHEPVLLAVARSERNGIFLMQLTSAKTQYQQLIATIVGFILIEILMTGLLLKAINGIVKKQLHDFEVIVACMRRVEDGNLNVIIPKLEQVEINAVALEYNRMLERVKQLMEINVQREVMVKEAQLRSLEKQINSHFLYNVLESIKMMAEVKEIFSVADALLALSRMFRYNLQIDVHSVTLQEEISYLESFLKLCNIRNDYYINLSENIEDSVRMLKVPKVILQPIAENSIDYGLDDLAEDTTIYIKAYVRQDKAYIEMTDMGKGMDEEKLNKVRQGILGDVGGIKSTGGIGLRNIQERIRLMYGEEYGLEIFSKEGCYTKVVLTIRAEETE